MSKEVKFRAWDKKGRGFVNGFNMIGFCTGQGAPNRKLQRYGDEWDVGDVILEQYTGVKDREGVEICEGDIIVSEGVYQSCSTKLEGPEPYRDIGDVKWSDIYLGWFFMGDSLADLDPNECKIIGDIHTTPELLEGKT